MSELIGGIGAGLFAVLIVAAIALVVAIVVSYMFPDFTFFVFLGCAALPVLTFACIMSAPYEPLGSGYASNANNNGDGGAQTRLPATVFYPNDGSNPSDRSDITDDWFPAKVAMMVIVILGMLLGASYSIVLALTAPPYVAPKVLCLRRQLEQMHPTWYR